MLSLFPAWQVCYAPIDLKNATIYVQDGFGVTEAGGSEESPSAKDAISSLATTLNLAGFNVVAPVGGRFTVVGSTKTFTISGRSVASANAAEVQTLTITATGGTYTLTFKGVTTGAIAYNANAATIQAALEGLSSIGSGNVAVTGTGPYTITFQGTLNNLSLPMITVGTGSLTGGSASMARTTQGTKDDFTTLTLTFSPAMDASISQHAAITFLPVRLEVKLGDGDVSFNEQRELEYFRDRGKLDTVREGDEQPMEVTLDFTWEFLASLPGATTPTVKEALRGKGPAANWYSSSDDPCEPFAVDIVILQAPDAECTNTLGQETITLEDFRHTSFDHSAGDGTISCEGSCNRTEALVERVLA